MAAAPIFIGTVKSPTAQISTANTNRDGTGTLGTVYTAGALGGRIDKLNIHKNVPDGLFQLGDVSLKLSEIIKVNNSD